MPLHKLTGKTADNIQNIFCCFGKVLGITGYHSARMNQWFDALKRIENACWVYIICKKSLFERPGGLIAPLTRRQKITFHSLLQKKKEEINFKELILERVG